MSHQDQFGILSVCTGNICRSPVAERLLGARLGATVTVSSAGTFGVVGSPISPAMIRLLRGAGVPGDDFVARRIGSGELLRAADLVLTMTKEQRGEVVELAPAVVRRTFTLREFARLLTGLEPGVLPNGTPAERLRVAVQIVAGRRSPSASDDIDDPFGRSDAAYARAFAEIDEAVSTIATLVVGADGIDVRSR